jgi:hypothetical protein
MQGAANNKPIDYLLTMIVAAMFIILKLMEAGKFEKSTQKTLKQHPSHTAHIDKGTNRDMIINGLSALTGIAVYTHISGYYSTLPGNGDSSDAGGGSSGCGGGCGGCGG